MMCEIFNVSRSGYYSWINRAPSKRNIINQKLDQNIKLIFEANKSRYGAPRITRALKAQNEDYSLNRPSANERAFWGHLFKRRII